MLKGDFFPLLFPFSFGFRMSLHLYKFSFLLSCATLSYMAVRMYMLLNQESSVWICMSKSFSESHRSGENITNIEWSLHTAAISKQSRWSFSFELLLYYLSSQQIEQQELHSEWLPTLTSPKGKVPSQIFMFYSIFMGLKRNAEQSCLLGTKLLLVRHGSL